jgi:hypothetical protein
MTRAFTIALVSALSLASCKPKEGGSCTRDSICGDPSTQLVCISGKWAAMPCKGPDGCAVDRNGEVSCDMSGNATDDACAQTDGKMVCSPDKKSRVRCVKRKTEIVSCDGPAGCAPKRSATKTVSCDRIPRYHPEDTCIDGTDDACDADRKLWLTCEGGKWKVESPCRGSRGCSFNAALGAIACDNN